MNQQQNQQAPNVTPAFMRPKVAADYLGMSRRQLYTLAETMPGFPEKIEITPRCVGWTRRSLDAWLASKEGV